MSNLDYSNIPNLGKKTLEDSKSVTQRDAQIPKGINNAEELCYTQSYQNKKFLSLLSTTAL